MSFETDVTYDEFRNKFIDFIEENKGLFGGGINEIIDGFYVKPDGTKTRRVKRKLR